MTPDVSTTTGPVWVAIDVAKAEHHVLIDTGQPARRTMKVPNTRPEIDRFIDTLQALQRPCEIAFEPTGDYHRPIAYGLGQAGFHVHQVSSIAVARTREALYNSWDKNDPKDAQVILHLLRTGATQRFVDPMVAGYVDLQEMANTYQQVSLRKVRVYHSIVTHHLPLFFPEARAVPARLAGKLVSERAATDAVSGGRPPVYEGRLCGRRREGRRRAQMRQAPLAGRFLRDRAAERWHPRGRGLRCDAPVSIGAGGVSAPVSSPRAARGRSRDAARRAPRLHSIADAARNRADSRLHAALLVFRVIAAH